MIKKFIAIVSAHKARFLGVLLFGLLLNFVFAVADPLVMKFLIDEGLMKQDFRLFVIFSIVVVLFGICMRGGFLLYELLSQRLRNTITKSLVLRMLRSYYEIPFAEISKAEKGYFISRIYDEPLKIAVGVVGTIIGLCIQIVTFLGALAVAVYLSWRITLFLSFVVPILYYLSKRFSPQITKESKMEQEEEARLREILGRSTDSYKTVRIFNLHDSVYSRVLKQVERFLDILYARVRSTKKFQTLSAMFLSSAEAVVLISAGYEVVIGKLSIGGLLGFMTAFWKVISAAASAVAFVPEVSRLTGYIDRMHEFEGMKTPEEEPDQQNIDLQHVGFQYNGKEVFRDLNLFIRPNERILILGPNGSGKSTLAHLLTRFLKPAHGNLKTPRLERISALLTPFHFPPGSLRENVRFDELSSEKSALFSELVDLFGLSDKLDQDPSINLSEGEKKKAQIILTLMKEADVYILDEPLAHIDSASKEDVMRTNLSRTEGKTLIVIMHGDEKFHQLFDRTIRLE